MSDRKTLTDKAIAKAGRAPKGQRVHLWDNLIPGFGVRVTDRGHKSFVVMKRRPGEATPLRVTLGEYGALTLAKAREAARDAILEIGRGVSPKARREAEHRESVKQKANSFAAAFEDFKKRHLVNLRTGGEITIAMEREMLPRWRARQIDDISRAEVIAYLDQVVDRGTPHAANHRHAWLRKFFNWAIARGLTDRNPTAALPPPGERVERDRVLTDDEIRAIWTACGDPSMAPTFGPIIWFLLVTAQRRDEAANLRWSEIDFDKSLWTLPRERTKADRAHEVPLPPLAVEILKAQPRMAGGDFVFTTTGDRPVSGWSKAKARLDRLAGVTAWRLHDLRRTAGTNMARAGVPVFTISRVLNHAEGGVTKIYARHSYLDEKRHALNTWAQRLSEILNPPADKVVPIRREAAAPAA